MGEPLIQLIFKGSIVSTTKLIKPETFIGRLPENDIVINNMGVSRRHARIVNDNGTYYIEDLDSANGFQVNGVRVQKHEFKPGDEIEISKHKLVFQVAKRGVAGFFTDEEQKEVDPFAGGQTIFSATPPPIGPDAMPAEPVVQKAEELQPPQPEPEPEQSPEIELESDSEPQQPSPAYSAGHQSAEDLVHKMAQEIMDSRQGIMVTFKGKIIDTRGLRKNVTSIGRYKDNDIIIDNVGVSRHHAQIISEDDEYHIVDQDSQNGIKVNGVQVKKSPLYPGDEIIIGKHKLIFDLTTRIAARLDGKDIKPISKGQPDGFVTSTMVAGSGGLAPPPPTIEETPSEDAASAPGGAPKPDSSAFDKYAVNLTLGGRTIHTYKLTKRTTCIGRLKENDIAIDNLGVSRLHAKIVIEENGQCHVEDQDSANGILVNNLPLKRSPLYPGDTITIGKHKLVIELAHKVEVTAEAKSTGMTQEVWQADSTMMLSEADREKMKKSWAERKAREDKAAEEAAKASAKPTTSTKPSVSPPKPTPADAADKTPRTGTKVPKHHGARLTMKGADTYDFISNSVVVGSSDDADIKLDFPTIKGRHLTITKVSDDVYSFKCHGFFTKVKVNGNALKKGQIRHMDKLKIGDEDFRFEIPLV